MHVLARFHAGLVFELDVLLDDVGAHGVFSAESCYFRCVRIPQIDVHLLVDANHGGVDHLGEAARDLLRLLPGSSRETLNV